MDQAKKETTTAFARRVLSRTLCVLGGTVATTAVAWAISSAAATADGLDLPGELISTVESAPVLDAPLLADGKQVVVELADGVGHVLHTDPTFGDDAKHVVDNVGHQITDHFGPRPLVPVGGVGIIEDAVDVLIPTTAIARDDVPLLAAPLVHQLSADPAAAVPTNVVVVQSSAKERAIADGLTRRGSPDVSPEIPLTPVSPAPRGIPAPAGSGHTGPGGIDAPTAGLQSAVPAASDLTSSGAARVAQVQVPATVAAQPGVTPD